MDIHKKAMFLSVAMKRKNREEKKEVAQALCAYYKALLDGKFEKKSTK